MSTATATTSDTRTTSRRRPLLALAATALALGISLTAGTAANASPSHYFDDSTERTSHIYGTGCDVTVALWDDDEDPGAAANVDCSYKHRVSIQVGTEYKWHGTWYSYDSGYATYAGYGRHSRTVHDSFDSSRDGLKWRAVADVWIDGEYQGDFRSFSGYLGSDDED